jgi:hypothetical protein
LKFTSDQIFVDASPSHAVRLDLHLLLNESFSGIGAQFSGIARLAPDHVPASIEWERDNGCGHAETPVSRMFDD